MALFGKDYDSVSVNVGGGFKSLPAGGYVCRVLKAQMGMNNSRLPMIEVMIDIIDGDYTQYFTDLYRERLSRDAQAKYPYNGILRITAVDENGNTKKNFKSFCTAIEQSNGVTLPREDKAFIASLKDMEIGVLFQREEFAGNDGNTHWSTKPKWFRSVETILNGDFTTPEDVPLSTTYGTAFEPTEADSFNAAEDDIPF